MLAIISVGISVVFKFLYISNKRSVVNQFSERFISQALNLFAKQNDYLLKLILENKAFENWLTTERLLDIYKNLKTTEIPTEIIASITKKIPNNYDDLLKFYHAQQGKLFKYKIIEQAHIFQFILDKHNEKREEQKATLLYLAALWSLALYNSYCLILTGNM
jgi:hypothetical protein